MKYTKEDYEKAKALVCPNLRYVDHCDKWISLFEEPCLSENCNWTTCHRYNKKFTEWTEHDQRRIIIVGKENGE